jgi:hypothetical protein
MYQAASDELSQNRKSGGSALSVHSLYARAVFALDRQLQKKGRVFSYSPDPACMFRIAIKTLDAPAVLDNGTVIPAGAQVAMLHIWNEQMAVLGKETSAIAWGLRLARAFGNSLRLLSAYLASHPDCASIAAAGADMAIAAPEDTAQLLRICARHGLIPARQSTKSGRSLHRLGENILIAMLALAQNPRAWRFASLRRSRVPVYITREELDRRFGAGARARRGA